MFAEAFTEIAGLVSEAFDGPYFDATVTDQAAPVFDDGGSIIAPGEPSERPCKAQGDTVSEQMRLAEGYRDKDIRLIVIGLTGALNTDAVIEIAAGPHAGLWSVESANRDTLGFGWECRGRPA